MARSWMGGVVGVFVVLLLASSAAAFQTVKPTGYCDGRQFDPYLHTWECPFGSEVTLTAPVVADWDLGADGSDDFEPDVFGTTTIRFRPGAPGSRRVLYRASDGSGAHGEANLYITADAWRYLHRESTAYCDGQRVLADPLECRAGQEVRVVSLVPAAWNPAAPAVWADTFQPIAQGLEFRYRYAQPGNYTIDYRSLDGQRFGFAQVDIAPLDLLSREPAFAPFSRGSFAVGLDDVGLCTIIWVRGYRAYRDHTYRAGLTLSYRYRARTSGSRPRVVTKAGRFLRQQRPVPPYVTSASERPRTVRSDDTPEGRVPLTFDPHHGTKVAWLVQRRAAVYLTLRERVVQTNGATLYAGKIVRRFDLARCKLGRVVSPPARAADVVSQD